MSVSAAKSGWSKLMKATGGFLPFYIAILLGLMGVLQAVSFNDFTTALQDYSVFPGATVELVALAVIAAELAAALLLVSNAKQGAIVTGVVYTFWIVMAFQGLLRGLDVPNCGCFGRFLSQPLTWWVIPQDLYVLAMAALIYRKAANRQSTDAAAELDISLPS